jgi:hypothetical protein
VPNWAHCSENPNLDNRRQLIGSSLVGVHQTVQSMMHRTIRKGPLFTSQELGKDKDIYINSLKYIVLQLASIFVNELYEENPTAFPPSPTHLALGNNTPSLPWFDHHSTASAMGQNQIRLSA